MIDVDHFKQVNDAAGHATGDAVLNLIAAAVCTSVRSYDLAARFAGDEFVALCCDCVPDQVHIPVGRIQAAVADLPLPPNFPFPRITLSIGAASIATVVSGLTCEELLERADDCLYAAKRHGRNCAFAIDLETAANEPALVTGSVVTGSDAATASSPHVRTLGAVMGSF
jgi:diguanylate cyclase (GGDEF)-like protein